MTTVLVELARTLVADFSLQEMLDHLAESVVGVLDSLQLELGDAQALCLALRASHRALFASC
jgi:hypothetical protein